MEKVLQSAMVTGLNSHFEKVKPDRNLEIRTAFNKGQELFQERVNMARLQYEGLICQLKIMKNTLSMTNRTAFK
jgi:hypothetical protein